MKKYFKKMKIIYKKFLTIIILTVLFFPVLVFASPAFDNLQKVGQGNGGSEASAPWQAITDVSPNSLAGIVGIVIQAFLGLLGVLFLSYILYAGYTWMTAQGEEEKVTKAKDTLQRAVIGLIVTIGAYAISYFVIQKLVISGGILK